jgi:hypothetical protein
MLCRIDMYYIWCPALCVHAIFSVQLSRTRFLTLAPHNGCGAGGGSIEVRWPITPIPQRVHTVMLCQTRKAVCPSSMTHPNAVKSSHLTD